MTPNKSHPQRHVELLLAHSKEIVGAILNARGLGVAFEDIYVMCNLTIPDTSTYTPDALREGAVDSPPWLKQVIEDLLAHPVEVGRPNVCFIEGSDIEGDLQIDYCFGTVPPPHCPAQTLQ